jgi:serine/threonine-protein kinase
VIVGRYVIGETFASGGMGTVHLGRIVGAGGFSRVVAVKRLYPQLARDGEFRQMLLDEARFVSRIRHPNVVPTLDLVEEGNDLYVVMEYVHGVSLGHLLKHCHDSPMPVPIAAGIVEGVLAGLHAAHEARGEDGSPLGIVHRDVSPQNILVGADGIVRLIDFGIAKARTRLQITDPGVIKGKVGYMAPEQLLREPVSRSADVYSSGVVLWEAIANRRLSEASGGNALPRRVAKSEDVPPSRFRQGVSPALDGVVLRALALDPKARFATADAMAVALREACTPAGAAEIARWLQEAVGDDLEISDERVRLVELGAAESSQDLPSPHVLPESTDTGSTTLVEARGGVWAWRLIKVVAAVLVGASATIGLRAAWHHSVSAAARASIPDVAENARPMASALSSAGVPSASALASPPPAPSLASPAPSATAAALAPAPRPVRTSRPSSKGRCDPPYTVDASGRKHYDPTCF